MQSLCGQIKKVGAPTKTDSNHFKYLELENLVFCSASCSCVVDWLCVVSVVAHSLSERVSDDDRE